MVSKIMPFIPYTHRNVINDAEYLANKVKFGELFDEMWSGKGNLIGLLSVVVHPAYDGKAEVFTINGRKYAPVISRGSHLSIIAGYLEAGSTVEFPVAERDIVERAADHDFFLYGNSLSGGTSMPIPVSP